MKILFISKGDLPDYQSDMILHGLRSLYQQDVVDYPHCWYMYKDLKDQFWNKWIPDNGTSYGRGFTIPGTFPEIKIDRENIEEKILDHFYDIIVYGSARRELKYLDLVLSSYNKNEIIFIDGEDQTHIDWNLTDKGLYFKRELVYDDDNLFPIGFCFPEEKIFNKSYQKDFDFAYIIPGQLDTYIYENEEEYYKGYRQSYFGLTKKKGGWDCLRHYEIMANNCLPYFIDIDSCPEKTLFFFPKDICKEINSLIESKKIDVEKWKYLQQKISKHFINHLTTTQMTKYIIDISNFNRIENE